MTNSSTQLKLAFIGGGETSAVGYVHFCASQMDNQFKVVAGAFCRNHENNIATAKTWYIEPERVYENWQTLIDCEIDNVDAFVVLTPTPEHLSILKALFNANAAVICEKSLVCGPAQVAELEEIYNPEKHFLAVTYNYSGYPMIRELQQLINKDKLGKIQKIHLEMPQEGFRRPPDIAGHTAKPQEWRLHDYEVPTIGLDLGVHLHHLSTFLLSMEPTSTSAEFTNHSSYSDLVDDIQMLLRYPDNIKGSMWMSKTAIGNRNGLKVRVFGDQGSATWFQLNPDELELAYANGRREIIDRAGECDIANQLRYNRMKPGHPTGFVEASANLYADIATELTAYKRQQKANTPLFLGLDHANKGLKLLKAAKLSYENNGHWQSVE
mgnify:CR=1 FL=1